MPEKTGTDIPSRTLCSERKRHLTVSVIVGVETSSFCPGKGLWFQGPLIDVEGRCVSFLWRSSSSSAFTAPVWMHEIHLWLKSLSQIPESSHNSRGLLNRNYRNTLFGTKLPYLPHQLKLKIKMESLMLKFHITELRLSCLSTLTRNQD